jgi:predicted enzyme related to lactoylglutathione lyase
VRFHHVEIAIDGQDVDRLADFWSAALGYDNYGKFEQYRSLVDPAREGPKLILQQVPEAWTAKSRVHLDLHAADVDAEVHRLEDLGASRIDAEPVHEAGTHWVRMRDVEGNEFCVVHEHE